MTTLLNFESDTRGISTNAPKFSEDNYSATIAATTDTTLTVPDNFTNWVAYFKYEAGKNVWVALNATAAAPAGATFASTTSEYLPEKKAVQAGDVIHFFSQTGTAIVGVSFFAIS